MLSNRQSQFILIRVSQGGVKRIVVPIPLFVLNITLEAVRDLAWLPDLLISHWKHNLENCCAKGRWRFNLGHQFSIEMIAEVILDLLKELRKYGRWRLASMKADNTNVSIDFY